MKTTNLSLLALSACILIACGGSGSEMSKNNNPTTAQTSKPTTAETSKPTTAETSKPTTAEATKPTTAETSKPTTAETSAPDTSTTPDTPAQPQVSYGGVAYASDGNDNPLTAEKVAIASSNLDKVTIKGLELPLVAGNGYEDKSNPNNFPSYTLLTKAVKVDGKDKQAKIVVSKGYEYVRFGEYDTAEDYKAGQDANKTLLGYFAFGDKTKAADMPKSGSATYKGHANAFFTKDDNFSDYYGTTDLTVNFSDNTVKGDLDSWQAINDSAAPATAINIDATISGNTFSQTGATEVKGSFYGPKAAELAGVAKVTTAGRITAGAAFGAKKQ